MDRSIRMLLLAYCLVIAMIIVVILAFATPTHAADLLTYGDLKVAAYDALWADSSVSKQWTPALVGRLINKSVAIVERECECSRDMATVELTPGVYFYGAPATAGFEGVLYAKMQKGGSNEMRDIINVKYEDPETFGQSMATDIITFTIVDTLLQLKGTPDWQDTLFISFFKISDDMDSNTDSLSLPKEFRPFVIDLVMAEAMAIRNNMTGYAQEQQRILSNIRAVATRRPQKLQSAVLTGGGQ